MWRCSGWRSLVRGLVKAAHIYFLVYLHNNLRQVKAVAVVLILELAQIWRENAWRSPHCEMRLALESRHASPYVCALSLPSGTLRQDSTSFKAECVCGYSVIQSCPTLCNPMDGSPPGSSVPHRVCVCLLSYFSHVRLFATPRQGVKSEVKAGWADMLRRWEKLMLTDSCQCLPRLLPPTCVSCKDLEGEYLFFTVKQRTWD